MGFALEIPTGLSRPDQARAMEVVGLGTSSKFLSNAYPLGGYSGLEVSLTMESLNTSDLSQLGNTTSADKEFLYPNITVGKGIYNDSDLFLHFTPPTKTQEMTKFGASYRWGFYQALFLPLNFSLVLNADMANIKNQFTTKNIGADLLIGMNVSEFSFFIGGGYANSSGQFSGGIAGVTASQASESQKVESSHFTFGGLYNFDPFFAGLAINRYVESVYSLKVGLLF